MPLIRPSLQQIRERVSADALRFGFDDGATPNTLEHTLVNIVTAASHILHGRQQYLADQLFDDAADDLNILRRAAEFGIYRVPAFAAAGLVVVTGNNGATILEDTVFEHDSGLTFITTETATISGGKADVSVQCQQPGAVGNLAAGTTLFFTSPIANVSSEATVKSLAGGADIESMQRFRLRFAERKQQPPAGGAAHDYVAWAKAAHPSVTRAWCQSNALGLGTVRVLVVADGETDIRPAQPVLDAIAAYIDTVRPAGMKEYEVVAPSLKPVDIQFTLLDPNTAAVQTAIDAELKDLFLRIVSPGYTLPKSHINEAISVAAGEFDHAISNGNTSSAITQLLVYGGATWPGA